MIIKTEPDEIQSYLVDASNFTGSCEAVYFPENSSDTAAILKEAYEKGTPVTVSGNGTGLAGGRVPQGGIIISTDKMNKIIEINTQEMYAVVEPGVLLSYFLEEVKKLNLLYPPDPTEKNCFIGGTVATNASGEKTFKYGPTRNYITALEVVLASGDKLSIERGKVLAEGKKFNVTTCSGSSFNFELPDIKMPPVKNASGYYVHENMDLIDLFIGSEGTLGVITKIKLKLLPRPEKIISCLLFFNSDQDALGFIVEAREESFRNRNEKKKDDIDALSLEFFDEDSLKFLHDDYPQVPVAAKAAVWFEQEVSSLAEDAENVMLEKWMELIVQFNADEDSAWFAFSENDKIRIQEFRHAISAKVNEYISKNNFRKLGTDVAVPDDKFEEFYRFAKNAALQAGLHSVAYGHFGNSHLHLNMLPKTNEEFLKGKEVYRDICNKGIQSGGTVSAEHGIGKIKTEYLLAMYGEDTINGMIRLKKVFDPKLILGQGTLFPL